MKALFVSRNFYTVLDVAPTASERALEKAYRKLSRKMHPEVNPGDPQAGVRYEELCQAFGVLGDGALRSEYDRLGHEEFLRAHTPTGARKAVARSSASLSQVAREIVGAYWGRDGADSMAEAQRTEITAILPLSFTEAGLGLETGLVIRRRERCGCRDTDSAGACLTCHGTGHITVASGPHAMRRKCPDCGGRSGAICARCGGLAMVEREVEVRMTVPAGVTSGSRLTIRGAGHQAPTGESGDLVVVTRVADHPHLERRGDNVYSSVGIMFWEAALGVTVPVETIRGKVSLRVPPGVHPGQLLRLRGLGIPNQATGRRGDHYVRLEMAIPAAGTEAQREAYLAIARLFPASTPRPATIASEWETFRALRKSNVIR